MVNRASQADYELLVASSEHLTAAYPEAREWEGSPFNWLLPLAPSTRGAVGRNLVEAWATSLGIYGGRVRADNQTYLLFRGKRVQVKLSTRWVNGQYRFQQIRDQPYDYLFCLGLSPDDVHVWFIPKQDALDHLMGTSGQHTGAGATETLWLNVDPSVPQGWLSDFGDQLSTVRAVLQRL
jgi:hypothetical protein